MNIAMWMVILSTDGIDEYYVDLALKGTFENVKSIYIQDQGCTDNTIDVIKEVVGSQTEMVVESVSTGLPRFDRNYNEPYYRSLAIKRCEEIFQPDWLLQQDTDEIFTPFFFQKIKELESSGQLDKYMSVRTATERFITPDYRSQQHHALQVIDGFPHYDPHCLEGGSKIEIEGGWRKIDTLFAASRRKEKLPKVFTEMNGERVLGNIQKVHRRKLEPNEIIHKVYSPVIGTLYSAPDHVFYTKAGEVQAQNLKDGDMIYCSKAGLDKKRREILLGTLMGDTVLSQIPSGKNRLEFAHGEKQRDYLELKCKLFSEFIQPKIRKDINRRGYGGPIYKISSLTNPAFKELHELCFREGRTYFSWAWLSQVTEIGLAFWYFDDGCLQKRGNGRSISFTFRNRNEEEKQNLLKMLRVNFDITAKIYEYGKNIRLNIGGDEARKFLKITDKYCSCSSMLYKTEDGILKPLPNLKYERLLVPIIVSQMKLRRPNYLYDLTVEKTHKYFAQHFLVHNTRLWRARLGTEYVKNPGVEGFFHCVLRPDPQPAFLIPGIMHLHLHRTFGPKAEPFWREGGDEFENPTILPFSPEKKAPKWLKVQKEEAIYTPYPWPDHVIAKWRRWGEYPGYDWDKNRTEEYKEYCKKLLNTEGAENAI